MRRILGLLLAAALLAGCTSEAPREAPETDATPPEAAAVPPPSAPDVPPRPTWRPLDLALSTSESWVKPRRAIEATLDAPAGARVEWYLEAEGGDAHLDAIDGTLYFGGAPAPDGTGRPHGHERADRTPFDAGAVEPGASERTYAFPREGRYRLAVDDGAAAANLTVTATARAREVAHLTLAREGSTLRLAPEELEIHPSTRIRLWNADDRAHGVREAGYAARLPTSATTLSLIGVDPGRYHLLALAHDATDARGEASARLVVDFDAPAPGFDLGPFSGDADADGDRYLFDALHEVAELRLDVEVDTLAPTPASVEVRLLLDGDEVAREKAQDGARLVWGPLPGGAYALEVRAADGVLVTYAVEGRADYVPRPAPP